MGAFALFLSLSLYTTTLKMTLDEKVNVLVLGGVGFIGRNFVHYLSTNSLVADIRVADKMLPQTAYLSETFKTEFSKIEFKQTNLINQGNRARPLHTARIHSHITYLQPPLRLALTERTAKNLIMCSISPRKPSILRCLKSTKNAYSTCLSIAQRKQPRETSSCLLRCLLQKYTTATK